MLSLALAQIEVCEDHPLIVRGCHVYQHVVIDKVHLEVNRSDVAVVLAVNQELGSFAILDTAVQRLRLLATLDCPIEDR